MTLCPICRTHPRPCPGIAEGPWRAHVAWYSEQWPHDADHVRGLADEDDAMWTDAGGEA